MSDTLSGRYEARQADRSLILLAGGMLAYCAAVTLITGDIGFEGDDWWIFGCPFRHDFFSGIVAYAQSFQRPIEGVYWLALFELVGFNRPVFHFFSLVLAAAGCLMMGLCLTKAFPHRRGMALWATLFAFFLPSISSLTYVLCTDNSRLSMLLFWTSVYAFQLWSERRGSVVGLLPPVLLYVLSFLTYEAPSFLVFLVPVLAWPVWLRNNDPGSYRRFLAYIGTAVMGAFGLAVGTRFLFLNGGAVPHRHLWPTWESLWSYPALIPFYLTEPFTSVTADPWAWGLAVGLAVWAVALITRMRCTQGDLSGDQGVVGSRLYVVGLALGILFLGMLPYQLAGYGSVPPKLSETALVKLGLMPHGTAAWFNFNWSGRIFSSASFGLALLLAAAVSDWGSRNRRVAMSAVAVVGLVFMVAFHSGLSNDWRGAAKMRNDLVASLLSRVPAVAPGTNFVFVDLESYHGRAPIFRGWNGLRNLIRMLYCEDRIGAWYLYRECWKWPGDIFQKAIVLPEGFVTRGIKLNDPQPHDSLLIFGRRGTKLALIDRVSPDDGIAPTGIEWRGAKILKSNPSRIRGWVERDGDAGGLMRNAWESGLLYTLSVSKVSAIAGSSKIWSRLRPSNLAVRARLKR